MTNKKYIYSYLFLKKLPMFKQKKGFSFIFFSVLTGFPAEKNMSHSS